MKNIFCICFILFAACSYGQFKDTLANYRFGFALHELYNKHHRLFTDTKHGRAAFYLFTFTKNASITMELLSVKNNQIMRKAVTIPQLNDYARLIDSLAGKAQHTMVLLPWYLIQLPPDAPAKTCLSPDYTELTLFIINAFSKQHLFVMKPHIIIQQEYD